MKRDPAEWTWMGRDPRIKGVPLWATEAAEDMKARGIFARKVRMRLDSIEVSEKVDSRVIRAIQRRMRLGWPDDMPLIVAYEGPDSVGLIDGNHRLRAALLEGICVHDVLLLPFEAAEYRWDNDIDVISLTQVMALYDPLMRANYRDDGGRPKCRDSW